MEQRLQKVNTQNRLREWGRLVEACRKSGQRVNEWCAEQGIPVSTYYSWQRKVFQAVSTENEVCFAELPIGSEMGGTAASIQFGELRVDIHVGADVETIQAVIQAVIQALRSC